MRSGTSPRGWRRSGGPTRRPGGGRSQRWPTSWDSNNIKLMSNDSHVSLLVNIYLHVWVMIDSNMNPSEPEWPNPKSSIGNCTKVAIE